MGNILENTKFIKFKNTLFILDSELKTKLLEILSQESDKQSLEKEVKQCVEV